MTMSRGLTYEFEDLIADCDDQVRIETTSIPTESLGRKAWRARHAAELFIDHRKRGGGDELVFAVAQALGDLPDHLSPNQFEQRRFMNQAHAA